MHRLEYHDSHARIQEPLFWQDVHCLSELLGSLPIIAMSSPVSVLTVRSVQVALERPLWTLIQLSPLRSSSLLTPPA